VNDELVAVLRTALRITRQERGERQADGLPPDLRLDQIERRIEVALLLAMLRVEQNGLVLLPEDKA
jgi:hypothetical protein